MQDMWGRGRECAPVGVWDGVRDGTKKGEWQGGPEAGRVTTLVRYHMTGLVGGGG